jgi:hypothetical protein
MYKYLLQKIDHKPTKDEGKVASVHAMKAYRGNRIKAILIVNLGSRWS